jgi:hypothetical protein
MRDLGHELRGTPLLSTSVNKLRQAVYPKFIAASLAHASLRSVARRTNDKDVGRYRRTPKRRSMAGESENKLSVDGHRANF